MNKKNLLFLPLFIYVGYIFFSTAVPLTIILLDVPFQRATGAGDKFRLAGLELKSGEQGYYPVNLEILSCWNNFYYVSGLKKNDPQKTPIILYYNTNWPSNGRMLLLNKKIIKFKNKQLLSQPWAHVRNEFKNEDEYIAFTNRLKIIKSDNWDFGATEGDGGKRLGGRLLIFGSVEKVEASSKNR